MFVVWPRGGVSVLLRTFGALLSLEGTRHSFVLALARFENTQHDGIYAVARRRFIGCIAEADIKEFVKFLPRLPHPSETQHQVLLPELVG